MKEEICLALGFFDCVHYGHRVIIEKLKETASTLRLKAVVSTFSDDFFKRGENTGGLIYSCEERTGILKELGVDKVLVLPFDESFKNMSAENFLSMLCQKYNLRYVVCGYDYRFGAGGAGDAGFLKEFCNFRGITAEVVSEICLGGGRVSSKAIKDMIADGEIERANKLLCKPYFISAPVIRGRGEGRLNDLPTANMEVAIYKQMPKSGVYATKTIICGRVYNSVTHIGTKPSYGDYSFSIETFIDGYSGDLYGQSIKVEFCKYLRTIEKFDSILNLKKQILKDLEAVRCLDNKAVF